MIKTIKSQAGYVAVGAIKIASIPHLSILCNDENWHAANERITLSYKENIRSMLYELYQHYKMRVMETRSDQMEAVELLWVTKWLIRETVETQRALPYKTAFYEYQRASYHEFRFYVFLQRYKAGKLPQMSFSKDLKEIENFFVSNEQKAYEKICEFPDRYKDLVVASERLHQEILELRNARKRNFVDVGEKDIFENWRTVYTDISDEHVDCSIIPKEEFKQINWMDGR